MFSVSRAIFRARFSLALRRAIRSEQSPDLFGSVCKRFCLYRHLSGTPLAKNLFIQGTSVVLRECVRNLRDDIYKLDKIL